MFTASFEGSRAGVIKAVKALKAGEGDKPCCQKQIEAAKTFIVAEIDLLPASVKGCRVDAIGFFNDGQRRIEVTIVPKILHL